MSINIQRSRERGVPSYVTYRNSGVCNLKANINSFEDLKKIGFSRGDIQNLKKVYEDVKDIDLFTGGLSYSYRLHRIANLFSRTFSLTWERTGKRPGDEVIELHILPIVHFEKQRFFKIAWLRRSFSPTKKIIS